MIATMDTYTYSCSITRLYVMYHCLLFCCTSKCSTKYYDHNIALEMIARQKKLHASFAKYCLIIIPHSRGNLITSEVGSILLHSSRMLCRQLTIVLNPISDVIIGGR